MNAKVGFMLDYVGDELQLGGTSNYVKLLAPRVRDYGYEVRVSMGLSSRTQDLQMSLLSAGIPVDDVDTSMRGGSPTNRLLTAYSYFRRQRFDIAHFMLPWWNACGFGILGAWLAGVSGRVATYHAVPDVLQAPLDSDTLNFLQRWKYALTHRCVSKAIAVSGVNRKRLIDNGFYSSERVCVVRNGIDINAFGSTMDKSGLRRQLSLSKSAFLITVIGYLEQVKGHSYFLEALQGIVVRHPNVVALLVGDGVLRKTLEIQVQDYNLSDSVIFTGWRNDVPRILSASDLLVLPSLSEGFPLSILEAMASGLPVVASDVGGISEAVIDGETGVLVQPASSHALEVAITNLLEQPELLSYMGKAGRERALAKYDVSRMVNDICHVYKQIM